MEKMILKSEQQRLKSLLLETIILLCKNGLNFHNEICIEGLIGITLDQEDIFLVNIKESIVPAEEVDVEQVTEDVQYVLKAPANNAGVKVHEDIREKKPVSFRNVISSLDGSSLSENTSAVSESTIAGESTISKTHKVTCVQEEEKIRPVSSRHNIDHVDDVISTTESDVNVRNNLTSNVGQSSGSRDHQCTSPPSRKRRRMTIVEKPFTLTPVTTHETFPTNNTITVSDKRAGHGDNLSRGVSRQTGNIKLENSELIEIKDEDLSEREDGPEEGSNTLNNPRYGSPGYVSGVGVNEGDVYLEEDGRMLGVGEGTGRPWQLMNHRANGGSRSRQEVDIECIPDEHLTACSYCGEQFNNMSDLYTHECFSKDTFIRSKSFKGFQHRSNTQKHTRVNSGERSFQCETCSKQFSTLFNLQRHELIHTGERPFGCNICNKRFTQLSTLRTHERIHLRDTMLSYQQLETSEQQQQQQFC